MSAYRYRERLIGAVVEQEFNNINVILLSGDIQRRESILYIYIYSHIATNIIQSDVLHNEIAQNYFTASLACKANLKIASPRSASYDCSL